MARPSPPPRPRSSIALSEGDAQLLAMSPDAFIKWWAKEWHQGVHVLTLGMTGAGKTVLNTWLCSVSRYVLALDAKGQDTSLSMTGWQRYTKWPLPRSVRDQVKDGTEPVRCIMGGPVGTDQELTENADMLRRVIKDVWREGRWTVLADELQILADSRYMGLGNDLEKMLIAARDRKISLVVAIQRPSVGRHTPAASAAITQSSWVFCSRTRDQAVIDRLAEITGRPVEEVRGIIKGLPQFAWAVFGLDPFEPVRLIIPPAPPKRSEAELKAGRQSKLSLWLWGQLDAA